MDAVTFCPSDHSIECFLLLPKNLTPISAFDASRKLTLTWLTSLLKLTNPNLLPSDKKPFSHCWFNPVLAERQHMLNYHHI